MRSWPALEIRLADAATAEIVQALLIDFDVTALDADEACHFRAFFTDADQRSRAAVAIRGSFPDADVQVVDVPDEDWAARSQADLRAVRVGDVIVAPPWDHPSEQTTAVGATVVVIKPSMGFGTGHHATTRLCVAALQRTGVDGQRVIDVGTGSGILAIVASLLGAAEVVAIDEDSDAIAAARDNLLLNPRARVSLSVQDVRSSRDGSYDIVIANLTGGLLLSVSTQLRRLAGTSGRLILSGILVTEEDAVLEAYERTVVRRGQEDEWVCLELAPPGQ